MGNCDSPAVFNKMADITVRLNAFKSIPWITVNVPYNCHTYTPLLVDPVTPEGDESRTTTGILETFPAPPLILLLVPEPGIVDARGRCSAGEYRGVSGGGGGEAAAQAVGELC